MNVSGILLSEMREKLAQCRQMMGMSDADLATYRQNRQAYGWKNFKEIIEIQTEAPSWLAT